MPLPIVPIVATSLAKLKGKIVTMSGIVANLSNVKKISLMKQKIVGLSRKEQIQIIYTRNEFEQLRKVLNNDELYKHFEEDIKTRLKNSFEFSNTNQHIFLSEKDLFRYIEKKDPNATIILLMETTNVDLYEVEIQLAKETSDYTKACAIAVGVNINAMLSNSYSVKTKTMYAVLKRDKKIEDTVMYTFGQWLKNNFMRKRIIKGELKDHAIKQFKIKNTVFYARINYVKRKMFMLERDNKHYYIGITKNTWERENIKQIREEMIDELKEKLDL